MDKSLKDLSKAKKIVVKIGSAVLTQNTSRLQDKVFKGLAAQIAQFQKKGKQFVLVSSGAIVAGKSRLKLKQKVLSIPQKQATAAVGQSHLIQRWEKNFSPHQLVTAQILLTHSDLSDRTRYLNARHTLLTLINQGVIPIINENDSVIVEEIKLGDNDTLSAYISSLIEADLLILLTDQDGLYDQDPKENANAKLIPLVKKITLSLEEMASLVPGKYGIGGMSTKVLAAKKASSYGIPTLIANGHQEKILQKIFQGQKTGTLFLPEKDRLASRKHWIAHVLRPKGKIQVDDGAKMALSEKGKSLLPSGVQTVQGPFMVGDLVEIADSNDQVFAKGLVNYDSGEIKKIKGKKTSEIIEILGYKYDDEIVHRNDMLLVKIHE